MLQGDVTPLGLAASLALVAVAVVVSLWQRLRLERRVVWAATRAIIQLLLVGAALALVIDPARPLVWSWLWVGAMTIYAGDVVRHLIAAVLEGIVAQRLVRRICAKCKEEYIPSEEQLMELQLRSEDIQGRTFYRGRGCENCNHSGYRGRMAIFEILALDDRLRDLIMQEASTNVLRDEARKQGMRTLRECGLLAIYEGQTTIDEVVRETIVEE
jgi:hypothetical protein